MNEIIIRVNNLSKNFGSVQAVKNISFEVKQSEIFAFWAQMARAKLQQ